MIPEHLQDKITLSLARLLPRLENRLQLSIQGNPEQWQTFTRRLKEHFPALFERIFHLYGMKYDFFYHLEELLTIMWNAYLHRPADLKELDRQREQNPTWFQSHRMVGGVCYVDLFAGTLAGLKEKIPYFQELGLNYLHLMPLYQVPQGENDGGYAVTSYREVNPSLGSMQELQELAAELRRQGISLVLDFVFNHTADNHQWAVKARSGDPEYNEYYRIFPDRTMPDAYEKSLREIFPDEHSGAFTYLPDLNKWVWTTFHSYQWDLNYDNPAVFNRMVEEMLLLANSGVEILRLDAVAFIWKEMGTSCENLPEAHILIKAFNLAARIAAPALLFKSEAIVHPDDVIKYISPDECQLSYNPLLMAMLWNTLATRNTNLLNLALRRRFSIPSACAWVNYVRCHDDIGWTFADEDAQQLSINAFDHRQFLNQFYTGRFPGSFARGLPFQENPHTGDLRISGTCASLAGLEKAISEETDVEVDLAIRRILLIHGVILTIGGIPLLYLGDEVGTLNDYSYQSDPQKYRDSRWVHRPYTNWGTIALRRDPTTIQGKIFTGLKKLIELRQSTPALSGSQMQLIDSANQYILGYTRVDTETHLLVFANFSEQAQSLPANLLRLYGMSYRFTDLLSGEYFKQEPIPLEAYQLRILSASQ